MSQQLINRSPDLKRLRDEGYDVEVRGGYLVIKDVPYVTSKREVKRGLLVSELTIDGERTAPPSTHVVMFSGEHPCAADGVELERIRHASNVQQLAEDLAVHHTFSSKPVGGGSFPDYYQKITAYAAILVSQAQGIDPSATAQTFPPIAITDEKSVFKYMDTATSRAGIGMPSKKLENDNVAIVGLGGTGAYVLDFLAKTPAKTIHLFDGDTLFAHNAFRSPGAASMEELAARPKKVAYLAQRYASMRRGIVPHDYYLNSANVAELQPFTFVFLCMATGSDKVAVVAALEEFGISFVDVGMGLQLVDQSVRGQLRVTTSTPQYREAFRRRAPVDSGTHDNAYDTNIQIADLNALNAALAVLKWKKLRGFYFDQEREHNTVYVVDSNAVINDETS